MKILALTNLYPPHYVGGYELHCQTIVEALRDRGHSVQVLTSDHRVATAPAAREPGVHRRLRVHGLFGHPFLGIRELRELELQNNATLREVMRHSEPDLVFAWGLAGLSRSMLFTLEDLGVPVAFAVCDHWIARSRDADVWLNWWNRRDGRWRQKALRMFWTITGHRSRCHRFAPTTSMERYRFRRLYFCSAALRDFTAAAGFAVGHGAVIYCPLDTETFTGPVKPAGETVKRWLYVGRLHEDKGVMTALRAAKAMGGRFPGTLTICGRGEPEYERQLREFAAAANLPVRFEPGARPADMPEIYRAHDALLFTSEWPEPFALTPLEAMACGLPVIGTMTGGSAELFRHRENALAYSAGNSHELAERMLELQGDARLRERVARAGQEEVRRRFARPHIVDQVEQFLEETVAVWPDPETVRLKCRRGHTAVHRPATASGAAGMLRS